MRKRPACRYGTMGLALLALWSCSPLETMHVYSYLPAALAINGLGFDEHLDVSESPQAVSRIGSDIAIVPVAEGLKAIAEGSWDYRLLRVLTEGNLWLLSTTAAAELSGDSTVAVPPLYDSDWQLLAQAFGLEANGAGTISTHTFRETQSALATGQYNNAAVDFVVLPEPFAAVALEDATALTFGQAQRVASVGDMLGVRGQKSFQCGLFINADLDGGATAQTLATGVDKNLADLSRLMGSNAVIEMYRLGDSQATALYGTTGAVLRTIQQSPATEDGEEANLNRLGFVSQSPSLDELELAFGSLVTAAALSVLYPTDTD